MSSHYDKHSSILLLCLGERYTCSISHSPACLPVPPSLSNFLDLHGSRVATNCLLFSRFLIRAISRTVRFFRYPLSSLSLVSRTAKTRGYPRSPVTPFHSGTPSRRHHSSAPSSPPPLDRLLQLRVIPCSIFPFPFSRPLPSRPVLPFIPVFRRNHAGPVG